MDRKSVIVLIFCGALFFAWSILTPRLYPPKPGSPRATSLATNDLASPGSGTAANPLPAPSTPPFVPPPPDAPEELLVVSNENARVTFTSYGGGIKQVELLKYPESVACGRERARAAVEPATLNAQARQPVLALLGGPELSDGGVFKLSRAPRRLVDANPNAGGEVVRAEKLLTNRIYLIKEFSLASNYLIHARVRFENRSDNAVTLGPQQWVAGTATPLNPQDNEQSVGLMWSNGSKQRHADNSYFLNRGFACMAGTPRSEYRATGEPVVWTAAQNQFFFIALIPQVPATEVFATKFPLSPQRAEELAADSKVIPNQFAFQVMVSQPGTNLAAGAALERDFTLYAGPKEYRTLERIGADLKNNIESVMGFGWFGFFSKVLLLSMNGLHALGLGYGLAIIAITVIIKLLFWPLTQASTRSMKRMQALQPQMKAIQEKYKDDPAKMNKKVMEFMRENKVSPLGGCLPLVLQIPVFIGFFQMMRSAIELRGATFLWACDLSRPDTVLTLAGFNVNPLPLLMGLTMFWQARLTPPSPGMDPMQQKIMKYFPLIFLFVLYNYSAGLTLYWTVQNLLSIAQMKLTRATETKAGPSGKPPGPVSPAKRKS